MEDTKLESKFEEITKKYLHTLNNELHDAALRCSRLNNNEQDDYNRLIRD